MGRYQTIVADPPWDLPGMRGGRWGGEGGRRHRPTPVPYRVMPLDEICALPVSEMAAANAHLYLWVPVALNREGHGAQVARAWGFEPLNEIVWRKPSFGLGHFPRPQHEVLMVCKRGSLPFNVCDEGSVQTWRQPRASTNGGKVHSAKPDGSYDLIERASPGPYLELFARRARLGDWSYYGDESLGTAQLPDSVLRPAVGGAGGHSK